MKVTQQRKNTVILFGCNRFFERVTQGMYASRAGNPTYVCEDFARLLLENPIRANLPSSAGFHF